MKEIEISKRDVLRMYRAIESAGDVECSFKFGYAIAKTRRELEGEVDSLNAVQEQYRRRRRDLDAQFATVHDGAPVQTDTGYQIDPAKRRDHLEAAITMQAELDDLMKAPTKIRVHMLQWGWAPKLTLSQIDGLLDCFEGEPPLDVTKTT